MPSNTYLSVIVPAYNEVKSIGRTVSAIRTYLEKAKWSYEVIVSADGNDGTREWVAEMAKSN